MFSTKQNTEYLKNSKPTTRKKTAHPLTAYFKRIMLLLYTPGMHVNVQPAYSWHSNPQRGLIVTIFISAYVETVHHVVLPLLFYFERKTKQQV